MHFALMITSHPRHMSSRIVTVGSLRPGDFVVPAQATVASLDAFGPAIIVEFTDGTATAPIAACEYVEIIPCLPSGEHLSAVVNNG